MDEEEKGKKLATLKAFPAWRVPDADGKASYLGHYNTKFTDCVKTEYLERLAKYGTPTLAARTVGVHPHTVYDHVRDDQEFSDAVDLAKALFRERLEEAAVDRAVHGVTNDVFSQGIKVGSVTKHSDRLMEFLLKAADPDKYSDKHKAEVSITGGVLMSAAPALSAADWHATHNEEEVIDVGEVSDKAAKEQGDLEDANEAGEATPGVSS